MENKKEFFLQFAPQNAVKQEKNGVKIIQFQ